MKREPLVSIVMNCYNGEKYLREAIDSTLAQTYENWEVIFWDNQSTDRSAEIFKSYVDPRLKYFYAPKHTWLYEARNYAIMKANGDFFAFLVVDDWWLPNKLEKQIPLFADPEVGLVCSNYWLKNEKRKKQWKALEGIIPTGWVLDNLLKSYFVGLLSLVVRRSAFAALKYPCDPRYHVIGDLDIVIRLSLDWKLDCIQEPLAVCRKHDSNQLVKHRRRHLSELECWIGEMGKIEAVQASPYFYAVTLNYTYQKAIYQILLANKKDAFRISHDLPLGRLKLKLWTALVLPTSVFQRLKSD
jgi:glycosyltransferase involved in cell wall biosynthesis